MMNILWYLLYLMDNTGVAMEKKKVMGPATLELNNWMVSMIGEFGNIATKHTRKHKHKHQQ